MSSCGDTVISSLRGSNSPFFIPAVSDDGATWTELDLPCKPGALDRRPCFAAPYHYRLDWNIWFIGFKPHRPVWK